MLGAIRPSDWNWLLFGHLLAAFALVAGLTVVTLTSLAAARSGRGTHAPLLQTIAFRTNLVAVIPAFVAVHVLGGILAGREFPGGSEEPGWLHTSFVITTVATVVVVALALLQYVLVRRARAGRTSDLQVRAAACVPPFVLAALLVVVVLMAGKPA
jgi:heme/copper-type cytochrome/quinol oxidase subunit 1